MVSKGRQRFHFRVNCSFKANPHSIIIEKYQQQKKGEKRVRMLVVFLPDSKTRVIVINTLTVTRLYFRLAVWQLVFTLNTLSCTCLRMAS